uniref:Uncharacterized protein n=1 Tax=Plectus sambesii TaxID=2011161 RepID=A0A914XCS0_9BILA
MTRQPPTIVVSGCASGSSLSSVESISQLKQRLQQHRSRPQLKYRPRKCNSSDPVLTSEAESRRLAALCLFASSMDPERGEIRY